MGGAQIYQIFLPFVDHMVITHVDARVHGDVFFPEVSGIWRRNQLMHHTADKENDFAFSVTKYTKL
jgi:dihydrofolate reductase